MFNKNVKYLTNAKDSNLKETRKYNSFSEAIVLKLTIQHFALNNPSIIDQVCSICKPSPNIKEHVLKAFFKSELNFFSAELKSTHSLKNFDGCLKKEFINRC